MVERLPQDGGNRHYRNDGDGAGAASPFVFLPHTVHVPV